MKKLPIATQLTIGFGSLIAVLAALLAYGIYQQGRLAGYTERLYNHPFTVTNAVARAQTGLARLHRDVDEILLAADAAAVDKVKADLKVLQKAIDDDLALARSRYLGPPSDFDQLEGA